MKKYYTNSDGGCFLFGNKDFSFNLPNGYGDCRNTVFVFESNDEFLSFIKEQYPHWRTYDVFKWMCSMSGCFNLYNYDCSDMKAKDIKAKFDGHYHIYLRNEVCEFPILAIVKE